MGENIKMLEQETIDMKIRTFNGRPQVRVPKSYFLLYFFETFTKRPHFLGILRIVHEETSLVLLYKEEL